MNDDKKIKHFALAQLIFKLTIPLQLFAVVLFLANSLDMSAVLVAFIVLFVGGVIRFLYKIICILVTISLLIIIITLIIF